MRNLAIYSHVDRHVDQIDTVQHVCVNSLENTVYMYDDGIVYCLSQEDEHALEKFSVKEHCNEELKSKVVAMSYNSVLGVLCLATEAGDLISLAWTTRQVEVVGSVEQGLRCMQWSPEEEVLLLVTGQNVVMAMTLEFDPLWEQPLHQAAFGEQAFVTVGWGSKQTQFHGSEGKAAAKQTPAISEKPSPRDDGSVRASWRGDGSLVAISAVKPETNARCIRIFSREGVLQATSESVPGLEMALAWRPSGNLIASTQVLPNKYKVIFFEKNGLHHGEFTLPFPPGEGIVRELSWNVQSDILSVWYENIDGAHLLLCSMGNYHWYVKQRFSFSTKQQLLACTWDPEANLRLHVVYGSLQYATYEWNWLINHSSAFAQINRAEVAVIDANDVLLTPFSEKVVPPPMCAERLQLPTNVNQVVLGLPSCPDNVCVVLSDGRLAFFQGPNRSLRWVRSVHVPMENQGRPLLLHHWVWALDQVLLCVATVGLTSHLVWLHLEEQEENEVLKAGILEVPLDGSILTLTPVGDGSLGRLVLQMASGGLLLLQLEQSDQLSCSVKPLACCPERLLQVHVLQICDSRPPCIVGLSGRSRLYVDGREVANNVTSMLVLPPDCLLLTTSAHTLLCLQLHFHDQEDAVSCTLSEAVSRRVERGSRLVVAAGDRVVLQMPRGNLETITPRALVLKQAAYNLDRGNFAVVFELFRKQRINLNLLVDHNPALFLQHTEEFVRDIKNPAWLSLLAVELSEEDTTKTAYADVYRGQPRPQELPWAEGGKRAAVCTRLCEAMDADGSAALFLPRLTALAVGLRDPGAALAAVRDA
ncbi:Putative elongator complex protein 1, partial [Gryllus bimaculatus]